MNARVLAMTLGLAAALSVGGTVKAEGFFLSGDDCLNIAGNYSIGSLKDDSFAYITSSGYVDTVIARDSSFFSVDGGRLNVFFGHGSSAIEFYGGVANEILLYDYSRMYMNEGQVDSSVWVRGNSSVDMTGGSVNRLFVDTNRNIRIAGGQADNIIAFKGNMSISGGSHGWVRVSNGNISITGGDIRSVQASHSVNLSMSAGTVTRMYATLYSDQNSQVSITAGTVETLTVERWLTGNEQATFSSNPSADFLAARGIAFAEGTVGYVQHSIKIDGNASVSVTGGNYLSLDVGGYSSADISGGRIEMLDAHYSGRANISGGSIDFVYAGHNTTFNVSGGIIRSLDAVYNSAFNISGGSVSHISARDSSTIILHGTDYELGQGLSLLACQLDGVWGYEVLGEGRLSGSWHDGTAWSFDIQCNDSTAMIFAVPEPATLGLLSFGAIALMRRRRGRQQ